MPRSACPQCGHDHAALGLSIDRDLMHRKAKGSKHLLRLAGGAWAYAYDLFEAHPEIRIFEIEDRETRTLYMAHRDDIEERGFVRDLGAGLQIIVPLKVWHVERRRSKAG